MLTLLTILAFWLPVFTSLPSEPWLRLLNSAFTSSNCSLAGRAETRLSQAGSSGALADSAAARSHTWRPMPLLVARVLPSGENIRTTALAPFFTRSIMAGELLGVVVGTALQDRTSFFAGTSQI